MRRSLDPEGYEDPALKSSQLSLGEMSSEWLPGGWGQRGHRRCTGVALHGHRCQHCMGVAQHGYRGVTRCRRGDSVACVTTASHTGDSFAGMMAPAGCQHCKGTSGPRSPVAWAAVQGHQHGSGALHGQQQCMDTGVWWLPASHGHAWLAACCQHSTGTLHGCTDALHEHSIAQTSCRGAFAGCQRGTGSGARSECGVRQGHPQGGITQRQRPPLLRPWGCEVPPPAVATRGGAELGDTRGPRAPREGGEGTLGAHSIPSAQARLFRSCHPEVFGLGSPPG